MHYVCDPWSIMINLVNMIYSDHGQFSLDLVQMQNM